VNPSTENESAVTQSSEPKVPTEAAAPAETPAISPVAEVKVVATVAEVAPIAAPAVDAPATPVAPTESSAKASTAAKPTRRAPVSPAKRSPGDSVASSKAPPKPDKAKTIAFVICGLLLLGIVVVGAYLVLRPKPIPVVKAPLDRLSGDAKALAEKALKAEALYKEAKEKSSSAALADLKEADSKLTEANQLFNEIVDSNQTVAGFKEQIELARDKKLSIDKELRAIRVKVDNLETQERHERLKNPSAVKPADGTTPVPATPEGVKEPTEAELSDANLDRLYKDDPSEYEKLAKIRKAKDPNYVIKKE